MTAYNRRSDVTASHKPGSAEALYCDTQMTPVVRIYTAVIKGRNYDVGIPPAQALLMPDSPLKTIRYDKLLEMENAAVQYANTPDAQRLSRPYAIPPTAGIFYVLANAAWTTLLTPADIESQPLTTYPLATDALDAINKWPEPTIADLKGMLAFTAADLEAAMKLPDSNVGMKYRKGCFAYTTGLGWSRFTASPLVNVKGDPEVAVALRDSNVLGARIKNMVRAFKFLLRMPSFFAVHALANHVLTPYAVRVLKTSLSDVQMREWYTMLARVLNVKLPMPLALMSAMVRPCTTDQKVWPGLICYPQLDQRAETSAAQKIIALMEGDDGIKKAIPLFGAYSHSKLTNPIKTLWKTMDPEKAFDILDKPLRQAINYLDGLLVKGALQSVFEDALGLVSLLPTPERKLDPDTLRPQLTDGLTSSNPIRRILDLAVTPVVQAADPSKYEDPDFWVYWRGQEKVWRYRNADYVKGESGTGSLISGETLLYVTPADPQRTHLMSHRTMTPQMFRLHASWRGERSVHSIGFNIQHICALLRVDPTEFGKLIAANDDSVAHLVRKDGDKYVMDQTRGNIWFSNTTVDPDIVSFKLERGAVPTWWASSHHDKLKTVWSVESRLERNLDWAEDYSASFMEAICSEVDGAIRELQRPYNPLKAPEPLKVTSLEEVLEDARTIPREHVTNAALRVAVTYMHHMERIHARDPNEQAPEHIRNGMFGFFATVITPSARSSARLKDLFASLKNEGGLGAGGDNPADGRKTSSQPAPGTRPVSKRLSNLFAPKNGPKNQGDAKQRQGSKDDFFRPAEPSQAAEEKEYDEPLPSPGPFPGRRAR